MAKGKLSATDIFMAIMGLAVLALFVIILLILLGVL